MLLSNPPSWLNIRSAAWVVGIFDFLVGPIGFLITNRLAHNPYLDDEHEFNLSNIHPEFEQQQQHHLNKSIIMTALQGLVLNEWAASMIYYPPIFLTFLVGLQFMIAVHQRNYCIGKLALALNYILVALLLILNIVLLANNARTVAVSPFLIFSIVQCFGIWIVFKYTMGQLRHPGVTASCYDRSAIIPTRFTDEDDLHL